jgi:S1-C subfamily serine protease
VNGHLPEVVDRLGPALTRGTIPDRLPFVQSQVQQFEQSTVRVRGSGCSLDSTGSGFVVERGLVLTNAHVVAGSTAVSVDAKQGSFKAVVLAFDPGRDLALLGVSGLIAPPVEFANVASGDVAVFGHPNGGQLRVAPGAITARRATKGRDIYDDHASIREVLVLAAALRPGDSGAAVVDAAGKVAGIAFAMAPDTRATAYALTASEIQRFLQLPRRIATRGAMGKCL